MYKKTRLQVKIFIYLAQAIKGKPPQQHSKMYNSRD